MGLLAIRIRQVFCPFLAPPPPCSSDLPSYQGRCSNGLANLTIHSEEQQIRKWETKNCSQFLYFTNAKKLWIIYSSFGWIFLGIALPNLSSTWPWSTLLNCHTGYCTRIQSETKPQKLFYGRTIKVISLRVTKISETNKSINLIHQSFYVIQVIMYIWYVNFLHKISKYGNCTY